MQRGAVDRRLDRMLAGTALALIVALGWADDVHAQDAVIGGAVTDATGLVLPGVTVEARGAETGEPVAAAVTDGAGAFAIAGLRPGRYDVRFTLSGFHEVVRAGVEAAAGAAVTLDIELTVELEEQVVVVGSRARPRSVTASPVPIDAIPFRDVASQGGHSLDYQLRTLVPSFNVATHPISGAASLVRPASLRNLAHDHTLVLVNGKRRHRSAILVWFGGVTDGTQGPDISTIPAIALRQVEVLRDGASAQYGSDAIAGVMNFLLKDDRSGGSLEIDTGTYRAGDGDAYSAAGNVGLPLGDTGFANLSFEYGNTGPDRPQRAAGRRGGPHRRREHRRRRPRPAVGRPDERGRPEAVRQLRPPPRQRPSSSTATPTTRAGRRRRGSTTGIRTPAPTSSASTAGRRCSSATCSTPATACATARPAVRRWRSPTTGPTRRPWRRCSPTRTASPSRRSRPAGSPPRSAGSSPTCRPSPACAGPRPTA